MADGSVNTSVSASGAYLPLAGGTLTGALNGTSAVLSGAVRVNGNYSYGSLSVLGTQGISWSSVGNDIAFGLATIGTATNGASLFVHTPAPLAGWTSGLGIDGTTDSSFLSTIQLTAYGLKFAGYNSKLVLRTSNSTSLINALTLDGGNSGSATFANSVTAGTQLNIANVGGKFAGEGGVTNYLGIYKDDSTPILRAVSNSAGASDVIVSNGNLVIGTAGKGIDFSANSNAAGMTSELLNDYEEGTWSPTPTSTGATFDTVVNASYTKIGRLVYIRCQLDNASAPTGTLSNPMTITNLPFTAAAGSGYGASLAIGFKVNIAYPAGGLGIQARVLAGTTSIELRFTQNDASGDDFLASNFDNGDARIALAGCYEV
jgi:hypothetical protein